MTCQSLASGFAFVKLTPSFELFGRILKLSLTIVTTRRGLLVIFVAVGLKSDWKFGLTSCSSFFSKVLETRFMASTSGLCNMYGNLKMV